MNSTGFKEISHEVKELHGVLISQYVYELNGKRFKSEIEVKNLI